MGEKKVEDDSILEQKLCMPDYISLIEKYKCDTCRLNANNVPYHHGFLQRLATCDGEPFKRTQCKKRCWLFSDLFCLVTATIIVISFFWIFSQLQSLILSLAWTIIFTIVMDCICCLIEYAVDEIFEGLERIRRQKYDNKVADIEAINREKIKEVEKQKEREFEIYKDINDARELVASLSNEDFERLKEISNKSERAKENKKELLTIYKELLKNIQSLLEHINLKNFYFSEIKVLFQIHLPKLREYIIIYIEAVEGEKETDEQIEELIKLLESFNTKVISIQEYLNNSNTEELIYKMKALRVVVSRSHHKEEE